MDASTLIYLAKAGALEDAVEIVGPLSVPPAVWAEAVDAGERKGAPEAARLRAAGESALVVRHPLAKEALRRASALARTHGIGSGESQVLVSARVGDWVLMDDGRATRVARSLVFVPISTVYLPVLGHRLSRISSHAAHELLVRLTEVVAVRAGVLLRLQAAIAKGRR